MPNNFGDILQYKFRCFDALVHRHLQHRQLICHASHSDSGDITYELLYVECVNQRPVPLTKKYHFTTEGGLVRLFTEEDLLGTEHLFKVICKLPIEDLSNLLEYDFRCFDALVRRQLNHRQLICHASHTNSGAITYELLYVECVNHRPVPLTQKYHFMTEGGLVRLFTEEDLLGTDHLFKVIG